MPSDAASFCCSIDSKWCWSADVSPWDEAEECAGVRLAKDLDLLVRVEVRILGHDRRDLEVLRRGRRGRLPFEARRSPRIVRRVAAVAHRPGEIDHRKDVTHAQDRGA